MGITIFNTDCANPSVFKADLFVYTVCNRFGVLRYWDISPFFCPFRTDLGYCCPLYIFCMRSGTKPVLFPFRFNHASVFSCCLGKILSTEMSFIVWTWGLFISLMISWKREGSVRAVCKEKGLLVHQKKSTQGESRERQTAVLMILWRREAGQKVTVHSSGWSLCFLHFTFC